jgi:thiamine biosynthesis protein ThiC
LPHTHQRCSQCLTTFGAGVVVLYSFNQNATELIPSYDPLRAKWCFVSITKEKLFTPTLKHYFIKTIRCRFSSDGFIRPDRLPMLPDAAHLREQKHWRTIKKIAYKHDVQVFIEGPGHVYHDQRNI